MSSAHVHIYMDHNHINEHEPSSIQRTHFRSLDAFITHGRGLFPFLFEIFPPVIELKKVHRHVGRVYVRVRTCVYVCVCTLASEML